MLIRTSCAVYALSAVALMAPGEAAARTETQPAPPPTSSAPAGAPQSPTGAASTAASRGRGVSEVVVTGSRISRRDYVSDTPIVTVSQELVASTGSVTLETSLNSLPQLSTSASSSASFVSTGGQANLDLRGLGTQRTLVLLNGRRMQPSLPNGTVDVNLIPSALVDGAEVITGGASSVYGSDAIAGVVNLKLKQHFRGLELDATAGVTGQGDGSNLGATLIAGSDSPDGRGNGFIALDYAKRDSVRAVTRDYLKGWAISTNLPSSDIVASASNLPSTAVLNSVFAKYGVPAGSVTNNSSLQLSTNQDGTLFTIGKALNYKGPTGGPVYVYGTAGDHAVSAAQVGVDVAAQDFWLAQIPLTRYSLFSHADYKLTDHVQVYVDGFYTHYNTVTQQNPAVIGSSCCLQISVPATNPFIPADLRTILASRRNPAAPFTITQATFGFGPRQDHNAFDVFQLTTGIKGDLPFNDITWEVYGTHGRMAYQNTLTNYSSLSGYNTLLAAADGGNSICAGGYNPFGINPLSPACFSYLSRTAHNNTVLEQDVIEGTLSGRLFALPAGDLRFAAGADYRRNSYALDVDSLISHGDLANTPSSQSTHGTTDVKEVYFELLAPVVKSLPFAKAINLDLGYRYSDYGLSGGFSTYKADADWQVNDWLTIRGGYAKATRAPSVGDLYLGVTGSQVSIGNAGTAGSGDPCDATGYYLSARNPDASRVAALCTLQGTPPGFTNNQPRPSSTTQGNLTLRPETADTYSIGFVLRPRFDNPLFSRTSLSIDYYKINVSDTIGTIGGNAILDNCYTATTNPSYSNGNEYCTLLSRSPSTGLIANISNPLFNLGQFKTSGIDLQVDWSAPFSAMRLPDYLGRVSLNVLVTYLESFTIQSTPTAKPLEFAGTIGNTQIDTYADAHPKWKATTTLGWQVGQLKTSLRWRYLDGMKNANLVGTTATGPGAPSVSYFDLDAIYTVRPGLELRAGIANLLDKEPPVLPFVSAGTDIYTYDIIGRRFFIALKAKF